MSFASQSNTQPGDITRTAAEDLTGLEGRLVKLDGNGEVVLPNAVTDHCPYVLLRGAGDGEEVDLRPFSPERNHRVRINGVGNAGDPVCLAAINGTDDGKIRAIPAGAGTYRGVAILEEDAVDEQLALVRPHPVGDITVT